MKTAKTLVQQRIRLRIPQHYHQEPVISQLVSDYGLTITITAAILGANGNGDGWFDLNLEGKKADLENALIYLKSLHLEIWTGGNTTSWDDWFEHGV
ncbi:MAG: NIL domain-containing protein [Microcoleaceae cyanobacterium]